MKYTLIFYNENEQVYDIVEAQNRSEVFNNFTRHYPDYIIIGLIDGEHEIWNSDGENMFNMPREQVLLD